MSLAAVKVWAPGEVLTAADLNAMNNNILNNPMALITPLQLQNLTSAPVAGTTGRLYYNTGLSQAEVDDGSFIRAIPTILSTSLIGGQAVVANTAATAFTLQAVVTLGSPTSNTFIPFI